MSGGAISRAEARAWREAQRRAGRRVVFTNGCFDILHRGHVTYLEFARAQGDALVVGLNSDESVRRAKGDGRPVNTEDDRAFVLLGLRAVDAVTVFSEDEPRDLIAELVPDVLVKGRDWAHYVSGREIVEAAGGRVVLADLVEALDDGDDPEDPRRPMIASRFGLFLALRYLRPKRAFLSVITMLSVLGVTLGVMVLILVISVMTGFELELQRKVIGFDAHLVVTNGSVLEDWEDVARIAGEDPGVVATAPFVQGPVLAQFQNKRLAPKIRGIDASLEKGVTDIESFLIAGSLDLDGDKTVIGSEIAAILGAQVGDKITIYSPGNINEVIEELDRAEQAGGAASAPDLKQMLLPLELEVTGIFESGRYLYDSEFLIVPLHIGQEIYDLGPGAHGLAVKTVDPFAAFEIKKRLNSRLEPPVEALTWVDLNRQLFEAIRMERHVMFFILMFIILVAAFGIMNTLITVTVQKTREIGILKALGARTGQIVGVFLAQGIVVGVFGTVAGLVSGILLVQFRNQVSGFLSSAFGIEVFPASVYQFHEIPAQIVGSDVALICVSAFVICSLAALLPAWVAARLEPVKALRYE